MINRDQVFELLNKYLKNKNLVKHSIAVEAILKETAKILDEDEEIWSLTGLLHDMDFEYTKENPEKHTLITIQILDGLVSEDILKAIKSHNYKHTMSVPETALDKTLIAADAVSGLIIATALVIPTKRLLDVELNTLINRFNDKSFAKGCNRKRIELCEDIGLDVNSFLELSLNALKDISDSLGF